MKAMIITKNLYAVTIRNKIHGWEHNAYIFSFEPMDEASAKYILLLREEWEIIDVRPMEITPAIWKEDDHKMMEIIEQL